MDVVVLMKPIHDPRVPLTIDEVQGQDFGRHEAHMTFGPYDENALETALQIKDRYGLGVSVVVMADAVPNALLRAPLMVGADRVLQIPANAWDLSPRSVATALTVAIGLVPEPAMVFAGIQSGDWDTGFLPFALAAELNWSMVTNVIDITCGDETWMVTTRDTQAMQRYLLRDVFVATVTSSGRNNLRYPTMRDRLQSKRKPVQSVFDAARLVEPFVTMQWVPSAERSITWMEGVTDFDRGCALGKYLISQGWIGEGS
ncbi:MAG: hypothetical protein M1493_03650 [Firmicutes bacterium]|jgi:electron transfer flavoprotein beta subunit|nr:hypothetical protein [Bacillota bacterium]